MATAPAIQKKSQAPALPVNLIKLQQQLMRGKTYEEIAEQRKCEQREVITESVELATFYGVTIFELRKRLKHEKPVESSNVTNKEILTLLREGGNLREIADITGLDLEELNKKVSFLCLSHRVKTSAELAEKLRDDYDAEAERRRRENETRRLTPAQQALVDQFNQITAGTTEEKKKQLEILYAIADGKSNEEAGKMHAKKDGYVYEFALACAKTLQLQGNISKSWRTQLIEIINFSRQLKNTSATKPEAAL